MIDFKSDWWFTLAGLLLLGGMVNVSNLSAQTGPEKKTISASKKAASDTCVPVARWVIPGKGETTLPSVIASIKTNRWYCSARHTLILSTIAGNCKCWRHCMLPVPIW